MKKKSGKISISEIQLLFKTIFSFLKQNYRGEESDFDNYLKQTYNADVQNEILSFLTQKKDMDIVDPITLHKCVFITIQYLKEYSNLDFHLEKKFSEDFIHYFWHELFSNSRQTIFDYYRNLKIKFDQTYDSDSTNTSKKNSGLYQ